MNDLFITYSSVIKLVGLRIVNDQTIDWQQQQKHTVNKINVIELLRTPEVSSYCFQRVIKLKRTGNDQTIILPWIVKVRVLRAMSE